MCLEVLVFKTISTQIITATIIILSFYFILTRNLQTYFEFVLRE